MRQQYLALVLLAILVAGCGILNPPQPTVVPYDRLGAQDVFNAFARAGLEMQNPVQDLVVSRDAPTGLKDRYTFEIPSIAPAGGQIIVFSTPDQLKAWQDYVAKLRNDSTQRRNVVFVYFNKNLMLELNPSLTNDQAAPYRDAFNGL
ncbi:MAG TPA: hypothetical protein VHD90_16495 [Phototrophicaceae bacterium]|nr:hypothetical protein [Phototrophicaceae bacterium]